MISIPIARVNKPFHFPSSFKFSTWKNASKDRSCQHSCLTQLFHHDIEDKAFCHTCHRYRNVSVLSEKKSEGSYRVKRRYNRSKFKQNILSYNS